MKNLFLIFIASLFIQLTSFAQEGWSSQNPNSLGNTLQEVSFTDDDNVTAVEEMGNSWFCNGPYGGDVNCVSVSKSNPNIVYIGTKQGVYKSENKGASWIKTGFRDYEVRSIKVSPSSPDIVFAGTYEKGFWRTTNGGIDWTFVGLSETTINCITFDPGNDNTVYFGSGNWMRNSGAGPGVFKTSDGGETFYTVLEWATSGEAGLSQVNSIFIDPDSSNNIHVGGAKNVYGSFGPLLYSMDGGINWTYKTIASDASEIAHIAVIRNSSGQKVIYILGKEAYDPSSTSIFYRTIDLGDSWEEVTNPYSSDYDSDVFMIDPNNSNTIYLGTRSLDNVLLVYKADQDKWDFIPGDGLVSINSTCIDISTDTEPEIYLGSSYGGIYNFTTGISSKWSRIVNGINAAYINDIAVAPSSPNLVYACIKDEYGLFLTNDNGNNWSWIYGSSPGILAIDPQSQSTIFAATRLQNGSNYYIYKSINGGLGWQPIKFAACSGGDCYTVVTDILIHPTNSQNILVSTDYWWLSDGPHGFGIVARTTDGGNTWDQLLSAPSSTLAIDPNNPDIIYSGKQKSGQIWKIENAWGVRNATEITPAEGIGNITDIELDNSSNVYVSNESGLWRYTAGNWTELTLPSTDITSLAIDRDITPNIIYAGTGDNGVFISNDGGTTWNVWNDGLKNLAITKLRIGGSKVWVGTEYGGVWCRNAAQSISPPYITHNTGNYKISIFQDGSLGHLSSLTTIGEGCEYKNNIDALYASGLIFGTQSAGYVNGNQASFGILNDFTNTEPIHEVTSLDPEIDHISQTAYNDDGAIIPYGVSVNQKAFSNTDDDFIILKFDFTSVFSSLDDFYAGIFADWDIGGSEGYAKNLGGYDQSRNLAYQYVIDGSPDPCYYGIVALSSMAGTKVTTDGVMRGTTLPRISVFENETITEIGDYRMWIGSGPLTLTQGVAKFVYFAFVAGTNLVNLQANADAAAQKYQHIITDVDENKVLPERFHLSQNYPNPFNSISVIEYSIPRLSPVTLKIFNTIGQEIETLVSKENPAGTYELNWNAVNVPSGVYFYQLKAGEFLQTKKMILLK
jgi:hypothetical protein